MQDDLTPTPESTSAESHSKQVSNHRAELEEARIDNLPPVVQRAIQNAGWKDLMPVQARAIPYIIEGRDVMIQARTGSGKTGGFVLPILARLRPEVKACQALVLVPTRELASQVHREAELLGKESGLEVAVVYGGVSYGPQVDAFRRGAQLVVGTPGRILDHLQKRNLELHDLQILVFDEADKMMSMGFYPDMREMRRYLPRERDTFMFSATFPPFVLGLANEFLREPELVSLSTDTMHVTEVEHIYYEVPAMDKDRSLVRVIEVENPVSAIIFCNTKDKVNYIATVLQRFGYDADQITADLSQKAREGVLDKLRRNSLRFLVATDLASRGIDIPNLSHVFLYDFPEDPESYIHRSGRTGRAGAAGVSISLVAYTEVGELERVAKKFNVPIQKREVPTDEDIGELVGQRVTALLESKLRTRDRLQTERMRRFIPLARTLGESDDELDLIAMLIDDFYQEAMHALPALPDGNDETLPPARHEQRKGHSGGRSGSGRPQGKRPGGGGGGGRRGGSGGGRPRR